MGDAQQTVLFQHMVTNISCYIILSTEAASFSFTALMAINPSRGQKDRGYCPPAKNRDKKHHWVLEVLKIPNPTFNEPFRLPNAITARYWASNHPLNIHSFHLIVPGTGLGAERAAVSI